MVLGLSVLTALVMGVDTHPLSGLYTFDPASCPVKSRDVAKAIFGNSPLFLGDKGEFHYAKGLQYGFWRVAGSRVVLVNEGFGNVAYVAPNAVLRRAWPKTSMEGIVFDLQRDGSLVLPKFGGLKGPITLRRMPRVSTVELLQQSLDEDYGVAWWAEWSRVAAGRFEEVLAMASNPKTEPRLRVYAASQLKGITPERADKILNFALSLSKRKTERVIRGVIRSLTYSLLSTPTDDTLRRIFTHRADLRARDESILQAIERDRMMNHSDIVDHYLSSDEPNILMRACRAASVTDHTTALARIRPLCDHSDRGLKVAALGAVARLSGNHAERVTALSNLHKLLGTGTWGDSDIVRAWEESGRQEALPYLVNVMLGPFPDHVRRDAATALGNLGFPEAVPALIRCKLGLDENSLSPLESGSKKSAEEAFRALFSGTFARQAAAESLWKFDQKALARTNERRN